MNIRDAAILSLYLAGDVASMRNAIEPCSTPFSLETTGLAGAFLESRSGDTRVSINDLGGNAVYLWIYKGSSSTGATEHLIARLAAAFPTDRDLAHRKLPASVFGPAESRIWWSEISPLFRSTTARVNRCRVTARFPSK